jgi:hypothetical protein
MNTYIFNGDQAMQLCVDTSLQKDVHTFVFEVYVLINVYTFFTRGYVYILF